MNISSPTPAEHSSFDSELFSDKDFIIPDDVSEALAVPSSLDLTGLTSHRSYDTLQRERWERSQEISRKLVFGGEPEKAHTIRDCHSYWTIRKCNGCRKESKFWNRCDLIYCPQCAPRNAKNRLDSLGWFFDELKQPKHVVLTFKNVAVLTKEYLRYCLKCLQKLRRTKIAKKWLAGIWAMEITNKGNGWHVHYHLIVETPWFSQETLSVTWKHITGWESFIVHVSDAGRAGVMKKLPKYVAAYSTKGTKIEEWTSSKICQFVQAIEGLRSFGVFGYLYAKRTEWRAWIAGVRKVSRACECGCEKFTYYSELDYFMLTEASIPPPKILKVPQLPSYSEFSFTLEMNRFNAMYA